MCFFIHQQRDKPNPGVRSPAELLSVLMCSSENHSSRSHFLSASPLLSIHFGLWGRQTVFAMVTRVCFHLTRGHTGFETSDNNPYPQSPACRAITKVRSHRGLMLCSRCSLRFLFWERSLTPLSRCEAAMTD